MRSVSTYGITRYLYRFWDAVYSQTKRFLRSTFSRVLYSSGRKIDIHGQRHRLNTIPTSRGVVKVVFSEMLKIKNRFLIEQKSILNV